MITVSGSYVDSLRLPVHCSDANGEQDRVNNTIQVAPQ
jgi:hypothetical protein